MHLGKAEEQLWKMIDDGEPNDLAKYSKASVLLDGFERQAHDLNGNVTNGYALEKISDVRGWYTMLCGVGEDGYTEQKLIENLRAAIGKLKRTIVSNGLSLQ